MTLINGGRTNTLSANVHGAVNWYFVLILNFQNTDNYRTGGGMLFNLQTWTFFFFLNKKQRH